MVEPTGAVEGVSAEAPIIQRETDALRDVFEQLDMVAFVFSRHTGQIVALGPNSARLFGTGAIQDRQSPLYISDLCCDADQPLIDDFISKDCEELSRIVHVRLCPFEQPERWYVATLKKVETKDSGISELVVVAAIDVHGTMAESHRKAEWRARLEDLIREQPLVLWTTDTDLKFTFIEGGVLNGQNPQEIVGLDLEDVGRIFNPDLPKDVEAPDMIAHRRVLKGESVEYTHTFGGRTYSSTLAPLQGRDSGIAGVMGMSLDTTELDRARAHVVENARLDAVGEFVHRTVNEFGSLLTSFEGYADIIGRRLEPGHPAEEATVMLSRTLSRARDLMGAMERLRTQGSSRGTLQSSANQKDDGLGIHGNAPMNLNDAVAACVRRLDDVVSPTNDLHLVLPENPLFVSWSDEAIESVLYHLVANAVRASVDGGTITVEVALDQERPDAGDEARCLLTVRDEGVGIPEAILGEVMEPFFSAWKDRRGSTGIGLSLVRRCVVEGGGRIELKSEAGAGTSVQMVFPLVGEDLLASSHSVSTGTALVVDPSGEVRGDVAGVLRALGRNVVESHYLHSARTLVAHGNEPVESVFLSELVGVEDAKAFLEALETDGHRPRVFWLAHGFKEKKSLEALGKVISAPFTKERLKKTI